MRGGTSTLTGILIVIVHTAVAPAAAGAAVQSSGEPAAAGAAVQSSGEPAARSGPARSSAVAARASAVPARSSSAPRPSSHGGPARPPVVAAVRAAAPPVVDGVLDDEVWATAPSLGAFTGWQPVEGAAALERTDVRVLYDAGALYVAVRAEESDAGRIRARLAERDRTDDGDYVAIFLDTFGRSRSAYVFLVNPLGAQTDGIATSGFSVQDRTWDGAWSSAGRVDDAGYTVELAIPLRTLRFPAGSPQTWRLQVVRRYAARGALESWAPVTAGANSALAQAGELTGLAGLDGGRVVELQPTLVASRLRAPDGPGFDASDDVELGLNAKLGLTSGLVLDLTANPDFSQVEADPSLVTANARFIPTLPEKRPFFLEAAEIFDTNLPVLYTRRIVAPVAGARLAGSAAGTRIGLLAVRDRGAGGPDHTDYAVLRVRRDLDGGSSVGGLGTYRDGPAGRNAVGGADGVLRFGRLYHAQAQVLLSDSRGGALDETAWAYDVGASRNGRRLRLGAGYRSIAPGFRAEAGYINDELRQLRARPDLRLATASARYRLEREDRAVRSVTANLLVDQYFAHSGTRTDGRVNPGVFLNLHGHTTVGLWSAISHERVGGRVFTTRRISPNVSTERFERVGGVLFLHMQEAVFRSDSPFVGWQVMPVAETRITLGDALQVGVNAVLQRFHERRGGPLVFRATAINGNATYRLTPALGVRGHLRWSAVDYAAGRGTDARHLGTGLLVSYLPTPGTAVFAGYTEHFSGDGAAADLASADRAFFVKAAYTWRR